MARKADKPAQEAQLSQAVWDVLAGQGLDRLTIRAVAAAAGCTTGLVMHRFPHRRALLLHARGLLHERTRARVDALEADAATPRDSLRAVLRQALALNEEKVGETFVWLGFLAAAVGDEEMNALHRAKNQAWRERVSRLVAAVAPDWTAERVATVAFGLIATADGAATLASADPVAYPPATQSAMLDTTLTALGLS
ncbi:TetR/AcrR family transcriptional regulator [Amycolatopsis sp. H20-H5]|uniref:TetR/AcrR family transcriptional regulator n=1 Tax=Amycolatopsis sp. H20-H5 TaxID=3046309 RepID=UPI002DB7F5D0|nr:TetR family transcriptional regulator C-terminal domain-containing protein [Amycolatopsis sp. H20-H5]MEC3978105.1 TetR family transcriptional regulator C-terminal domain-containing protein [Amycolatopsis sp. H20-H5]